MQIPAVLVFVRAPRAGEVKTRLAAALGDDAALRIYRRLARHAVDAARALGREAAVRVHYTPADAEDEVSRWLAPGPRYLPQVGGDLGERMRHAFDEAFRAGHSRVVIVGSDLPELTSALLRRALALLEDHPAVIGPARDGGYWLLGLRQPRAELFREIPWSTPEVCRITVERLRLAGWEPARLPVLVDVDEPGDLPPGWAEAQR